MNRKLHQKFQNKWIKVDILGELKPKDFYVSSVILNEKDNDFNNCGHVFIKYEGKGTWKITDFEIDNHVRGQNFGAAMILNALRYIEILQNEHEDIENLKTVHGIIGLIFIDDYDGKDVNKSSGYKKVKDFYERLDFDFYDDISFKKDVSNSNINDWMKYIESQIQIRELKVENAVQKEILKQYENSLNHIESKWLGRILLKTEGLKD